jgi:lipoyl(octanoyl) transferase
MIDVCAAEGVAADRREGHPGCWCAVGTAAPRKIGALGVRVERGVTYHGIALNADTDLTDFGLIDPCGMPDVISTSIAEELGRTAEPPTTAVVGRVGAVFARSLAATLDATLEGDLPPVADPVAERAALEADLAAAEAAMAGQLAPAAPPAAPPDHRAHLPAPEPAGAAR